MGYKAIELDAGTDPAALDPVFEQLIRNLAPAQSPVLRIAGADEAWWPVPHTPRPPGVNYNLTNGLAVTRALAQTLDARLILGINFEADSATVAGAEARALVSGIGPEWIAALEPATNPSCTARSPGTTCQTAAASMGALTTGAWAISCGISRTSPDRCRAR